MKNISIGVIAAIGVVLLLLSPTQAESKIYTRHGSFSDKHCDYSIEDFEITEGKITLQNVQGEEVVIENHNLYIDDEPIELTRKQQDLVKDYEKGIYSVSGEVALIVKDGIGIGVKAATMAVGTILGEDDPDYERFTAKFQELALRIETRINSKQFNSKNFDHEFEHDIEEVVNETMTMIAPRMIAKIATAAVAGNEDEMRRIEERAERVEYEVETMLEPEIKLIEARAEALCKHIDHLDYIEDKMIETHLAMDIIKK